MKKLFAAVAVSLFAASAVSAFAADTGKKNDLTTEQRAEMRARADQMKMQRNAASSPGATKEKAHNKEHKAK
jgi:hypothetical protein